MDSLAKSAHNIEQMTTATERLSTLEAELLLQLGERLKRARIERGQAAIELAQHLGISRNTLAAIEAGSGSPSMGNYLRVMSALDVAGDLVMVAGRRSAGWRAPALKPIRSDAHIPQDLQSLLMHQEAVRLLKLDPALASCALHTLARWRAGGDPRTRPLWGEWERIILAGDWKAALEETERGDQLRQASPLATLLPAETRKQIIAFVKSLKTRGAHAAA
jgi:transcriptional regulator with XRE-family HTH domain